LQHFQHPGDGLVQVQDLGRNGLFAGKGQQLSRQASRVMGRLLDFQQV